MARILESTQDFHMDDLQPLNTLGGYHAVLTEQGIRAHAYLDPMEDNPQNGYALTSSFERVANRGTMSERQRERGRELAPLLRERMKHALLDAGWVMVGTTSDTPAADIWKHQSRLPLSTPEYKPGDPQSQPSHQAREQRTINVIGSKEARARGQEPAYSRTVWTRLVTFICVGCQQEVAQERYPGPRPRYCDTCVKEATRERTRQRVQRLREHRKQHAAEPTPTKEAEGK